MGRVAEIINLNRARKARDKAQAKSKAQANRLTFGRTKLERLSKEKQADRDKAHLDGHRLDDD